MPIYTVYTKIESNVPTENLLYDFAVYRMDSKKNKHYLVNQVTKQTLQSNYETQRHNTIDITDPVTTTYMVEIMVYRKHFNNVFPALTKPFIRMYTLNDLMSGKACSEKKRGNACYFESEGESKPVSAGDNTIPLKITVPERQFIAKNYPVGSPKDPFAKNLIETDIERRLNHYTFPDQGWTSLCGPAALFYCLQKDRPDIYAQSARELWQYGRTKIGMLEITPSNSYKPLSGSFYKPTTTGQKKVSGLDSRLR
ncbi:hypothetical protein KY207_003242 [Providencia stuartii]